MSDRDRRTPDGNAKRQARMRRHRIKARSDAKQIIAALKDRPCADCGGRFPAVCMDFDHRDRTQKIAQVTKFVTRGKRALFREIAKCDVVCANCHRLRTHRQRDHRALCRQGKPDFVREDRQLQLLDAKQGLLP